MGLSIILVVLAGIMGGIISKTIIYVQRKNDVIEFLSRRLDSMSYTYREINKQAVELEEENIRLTEEINTFKEKELKEGYLSQTHTKESIDT